MRFLFPFVLCLAVTACQPIYHYVAPAASAAVTPPPPHLVLRANQMVGACLALLEGGLTTEAVVQTLPGWQKVRDSAPRYESIAPGDAVDIKLRFAKGDRTQRPTCGLYLGDEEDMAMAGCAVLLALRREGYVPRNLRAKRKVFFQKDDSRMVLSGQKVGSLPMAFWLRQR